ncbi:MAG: MFS transporter [Treponema sp.]|nr:MFS transporter [Treponema sp.]
MNENKTGKTGAAEMLSFGGLQFALGIYTAFSSYYLVMFCTDIAMISPAVTAILLLCYRLFNVINSQVMGIIINRSSFKEGKYRPYFKLFALPFAISLAALGLSPLINAGIRIIYTALVLIVLDICWSILCTASLAMLPYLADDDVNRTKFISFSNSSAILAFIVIGTFMLPLADFSGNGNRANGFVLTLAIFALIAAPLIFFAYIRLKESPNASTSIKSGAKPGLKKIFLTVGRNKRIMLFLAGFCLYSIASSFRNLTTYYYITYNAGLGDLLPVIILAGLISPLAAQPVIPRLLKYAKKETLIIFGLFASSFISLLVLAAGNNPAALITCAVFYGLFTAIAANLVYAVMASFSDEMLAKEGMSMSEILTAALNFTSNIGSAITNGAVPMVMAAFGYSALAVSQSAGTLSGIRALYIFCTAGGLALSGFVVLLFRREQLKGA